MQTYLSKLAIASLFIEEKLVLFIFYFLFIYSFISTERTDRAQPVEVEVWATGEGAVNVQIWVII